MLRLCIVSKAYSIHAQRWVKAFAEKLEYDVTFISPHRGLHTHQSLFGSARVHCLPAAAPPAKKRYIDVLKNYYWTRRKLLSERYDLVHVHQLPPPLMAGFFIGVPNLLVSVWGSDIGGVPGQQTRLPEIWSRKVMLKQAVAVTATSNYLAEKTRTYTPQSTPIHLVPFGVDTSVFTYEPYRNKLERPIRLIVTKHLRPIYGITYLLRALAMIYQAHPDIELILLGDGEQREELEQLAVTLGITDIVSFVGSKGQTEVVQYLHSSHIAVMPSISESFGVAALEAQATGLPVIASDVGGIPEAVKDGETGLLVNPGDSKALARAIMYLIDNPDLQIMMGKKGVNFVENNYSWSRSVRNMDSIYRQIARIP